MAENAWRDDVCPGFGHVYCDCPYAVIECEGAWNCKEINDATADILNAYDINADGTIDLEAEIEAVHLDYINANCDFNGD